MKKSKKVLSFFLSIIMILCSLGPIGMTASAQTYRNSLKKKGFPDSYRLQLADTHLYKQFRNSVTVNVIEAIARKIKEELDASK